MEHCKRNPVSSSASGAASIQPSNSRSRMKLGSRFSGKSLSGFLRRVSSRGSRTSLRQSSSPPSSSLGGSQPATADPYLPLPTKYRHDTSPTQTLDGAPLPVTINTASVTPTGNPKRNPLLRRVMSRGNNNKAKKNNRTSVNTKANSVTKATGVVLSPSSSSQHVHRQHQQPPPLQLSTFEPILPDAHAYQYQQYSYQQHQQQQQPHYYAPAPPRSAVTNSQAKKKPHHSFASFSYSSSPRAKNATWAHCNSRANQRFSPSLFVDPLNPTERGSVCQDVEPKPTEMDTDSVTRMDPCPAPQLDLTAYKEEDELNVSSTTSLDPVVNGDRTGLVSISSVAETSIASEPTKDTDIQPLSTAEDTANTDVSKKTDSAVIDDPDEMMRKFQAALGEPPEFVTPSIQHLLNNDLLAAYNYDNNNPVEDGYPPADNHDGSYGHHQQHNYRQYKPTPLQRFSSELQVYTVVEKPLLTPPAPINVDWTAEDPGNIKTLERQATPAQAHVIKTGQPLGTPDSPVEKYSSDTLVDTASISDNPALVPPSMDHRAGVAAATAVASYGSSFKKKKKSRSSKLSTNMLDAMRQELSASKKTKKKKETNTSPSNDSGEEQEPLAAVTGMGSTESAFSRSPSSSFQQYHKTENARPFRASALPRTQTSLGLVGSRTKSGLSAFTTQDRKFGGNSGFALNTQTSRYGRAKFKTFANHQMNSEPGTGGMNSALGRYAAINAAAAVKKASTAATPVTQPPMKPTETVTEALKGASNSDDNDDDASGNNNNSNNNNSGTMSMEKTGSSSTMSSRSGSRSGSSRSSTARQTYSAYANAVKSLRSHSSGDVQYMRNSTYSGENLRDALERGSRADNALFKRASQMLGSGSKDDITKTDSKSSSNTPSDSRNGGLRDSLHRNGRPDNILFKRQARGLHARSMNDLVRHHSERMVLPRHNTAQASGGSSVSSTGSNFYRQMKEERKPKTARRKKDPRKRRDRLLHQAKEMETMLLQQASQPQSMPHHHSHNNRPTVEDNDNDCGSSVHSTATDATQESVPSPSPLSPPPVPQTVLKGRPIHRSAPIIRIYSKSAGIANAGWN